MKPGTLIAIEGIDGAGKTTQAGLLAAALNERGHRTVITHEPTRGRFGQLIRETANRGIPASPGDELSWFMADREEHVSQVIAPALNDGRVVITDRYYLSTVAYQGARGLSFSAILEESERRFPQPDLAVLLRIDPCKGLERVHARGSAINPVFERIDFLETVAEVFEQIDRRYIDRIDAEPDVSQVRAAIVAAVRARLALR